MLTLVEPCITTGFLDRPDLGCAMLIAACREKGIKTTLIKGQTRYLKDMFVTDSAELWGLIQHLDEEGLRKTGIAGYKRSIKRKGVKRFQAELESLYRDVVIDKNPRVYYNAHIMDKFNQCHKAFLDVYLYYLTELKCSKLKIIDRYVNAILDSKPQYVGFSLKSFEPFMHAVIKRIKGSTDIPVIAGGSFTPFIDLNELDKIFEERFLDYLVIGCGERALPSLIASLENNKLPAGIANVCYRKNGKVICNDRGVVDDVESLPCPDFSQFDLDLYLTPKRILPLQTARGCSWRRCAFCSHCSIYFGTYNAFSSEMVIRTIRHLQNTYGCSHFVFHDEELPAARAKRISEAIVNNKVKDISIYCYARLTNGYNNDGLLRCLRRAGFSMIVWGMESGCQRVLDLINKGTDVSVMSQILKKSSRNKIANMCFVLFGFPGETRKEAQQTVGFLKKHADYIEDVIYQSFVLDVRSPVGRNPGKWGIEMREDGTYSVKSGMNPDETGSFYHEFDMRYLFNSSRIISDHLKYLLPGTNRRMLRFLSASQELLPNAIASKYLKKRKLNDIFPMILGEIKKKGGKAMLYPVNITEPAFINQTHPNKTKVLDSLERKMFHLSDGAHSMEDIISVVKNRKKCTDFFRAMFMNNLALGFAKSWKK